MAPAGGTAKITRGFGVLSVLREMQASNQMTDTLLRSCDGQQMMVHSLVLALHPLWSNILKDADEYVVLFPDSTRDDILQFVDSIYSNSNSRSDINAVDSKLGICLTKTDEEIIKIEPSDFIAEAGAIYGAGSNNGSSSNLIEAVVNTDMPVDEHADNDNDDDFADDDDYENELFDKEELGMEKEEHGNFEDVLNTKGEDVDVKEEDSNDEELDDADDIDRNCVVINKQAKAEMRKAYNESKNKDGTFTCRQLKPDGSKCDVKPCTTAAQIKYHLSKDHIKDLYYCIKCDKSIDTRSNQYFHMKYWHSKERTTCPKCGVVCRDSKQLKKHAKKCQKPPKAAEEDEAKIIVVNSEVKKALLKAVKESRKTTSDGLTVFQCNQKRGADTTCSLVFDGMKKFRNHLQREHLPGYYKCTLCDKSINNRYQQSQHLSLAHPDVKVKKKPGKPVKCEQCEFIAPNNLSLKTHMDKFHSGRPPPSPQDPKMEEKATCDICLREYTTLRNMLDHKMKIHEGIGGIPCEICGKIFRTMRAVERHAEIHAGIIYPCDKCGKEFNSKQALTSHTKNYHGKVQEYLCMYCGKSSNTYVTHKRHQESHTKERKFVCDVCPAAYNRKHKLDMHKKTHSDAKEFECDVCHAKFKVLYILQRHKAIHQERRHKCNICKFASHQSYDLTRHYRTVHSIDRPKETYLNFNKQENIDD